MVCGIPAPPTSWWFPAMMWKLCRDHAVWEQKENPTRNLTILRWIFVHSRELESLALWLKESKVHHSSNPKSTKKRKFIRIIARSIFAHTALFAYSGMLCNCYPAVQVCKKCAKMCRRAKQSPMDKSTTGSMAGFRTSEQTPFYIEMRFTMNKLLSCRYWEKAIPTAAKLS